MNNRIGKCIVCLFAMVVLANQSICSEDDVSVQAAKLPTELGTPFADNAILQQGMKVPVWGWSNPGTGITVEFQGQKKTIKAGDNQKWMVELDPLKASFEPATMTITESSGAKVVITNILVGEVWLASGQSNMNRPVSKTDVGVLGPPTRAGLATIRQCNAASSPAMHPIERVRGVWSTNWMTLNAISYSFAHKLQEELDVPVGIVHCAVGETSIRTWTPRCGFAEGQDEYTKEIYQGILKTDPTTPEHKKAWGDFYQGIEDGLAKNKELVAQGKEAKRITGQPPGNMASTRDNTWMFNGMMHPMTPYAIRGALWNQGYHSMYEGIVYYNNLHSLITGWRKEWNRPDLPVYFHQFYTPGEGDLSPSLAPVAEMRLGTWLARDIPNADMVIQIDIGGEIHYKNKALPGLRFANMALKKQYPQTVLKNGKKAADLVVHGPMFKSYKVDGNQVIVELEHTDGDLLVAETGTQRSKIAEPTIIPNGEDKVKLFYLAGEDRVWHPASMKISGEKVIVTSPGVPKPRGISYATGGVAWQPNLYNRALLPTAPFIYYDNKLVTSKDWPGSVLKIAGQKEELPDSENKELQFRNLPLLSGQFREDAVFQADAPVTIWGSVRAWGIHQDQPEKGVCKVLFEFGDLKKTIDVTPEMREWQVVVPPMKASAEPRTLKVAFTQDGKVVHERVCPNIVYGDVFYVAGPSQAQKAKSKSGASVAQPSGQIVRMMLNRSKRSAQSLQFRYTVSVSTKSNTSNSSIWEDASGEPGTLGHAIAAKTKRPVGIIFMETKGEKPPLKDWMPLEAIKQVPGLIDDYKQLASIHPGNEFYDANVRRYVADWKKYWSEYVPQMIATAKVPDGAPWGAEYPTLGAGVNTTASSTWNVSVLSFTPASLKGVIFLGYPELFKDGREKTFGPELTAMANCWKARFSEPDPHFFYTVPAKALVPEFTSPDGIKGKSTAVELGQWDDLGTLVDQVVREMHN